MRSHESLKVLGLALVLAFAANMGAAERPAPKAEKAKKTSDSKKPQAQPENAQPVAVGEAGMIVVRDAETGELRPAAGNEAAEFLKNVVPAANRSDEGLVKVTMPDGSIMIDLQGRYQEYSLVQRDASGKLEPGCVSEAPAKTATTVSTPAVEVK